MGMVQSGNAVHDANCAASETQRQADAAAMQQIFDDYYHPARAATNFAVLSRTIDASHLRRCYQSALVTGVNPLLFLTGLRELGSGP